MSEVIDSARSKFYFSKFVDEQCKKVLKLNFFSPRDSKHQFVSAKVFYLIGSQTKGKIKEDSVVFKNNKNGKYSAEIKFDFKKGNFITGYFSEFVSIERDKNDNGGTMGNSTMYFTKDFD